MPIRSRRTACLLAGTLLWLGLSGAQAQQPAGAWTDPPARKPAAAADAPKDTAKAAAKADVAPDVAAKARPGAAQRSADAGKRGQDGGRIRAKRAASRMAVPHRTVRRSVQEPRRLVRVAPGARIAAARPRPLARWGQARTDGGPTESLPVGVVPPTDTLSDPRLERLRSAEEAGYIVVRRRTVEFPDGRTLRVYRPRDVFDDPD